MKSEEEGGDGPFISSVLRRKKEAADLSGFQDDNIVLSYNNVKIASFIYLLFMEVIAILYLIN